ncbi:TonB family protein [Sphingomonas sp. AR_OL41]|uniref:energy transducer TonB n=1 Tax=Sphingomonas sp. AR_OL41 TaxID=3042729 RepID=UPI002481534C|nr:TonB family protein [Sphingomonas sp. AR_OL41]MDH7971008.1 TonB family protein [Sphingomonas sp. AR_OL41]
MGIRGQFGLMLALAIVPASALASDKASPPHVIGNAGSYFGPDAYPPEALRAGEQGRVIASVAVDVGGTPTGCTTATSSGSASLDTATCAIAMAKIHFTPALDSRGRPTTGSYNLAVRWVLPVDDSPAAQKVITFGGTPAAPVCATVVGGATRHLVPGTCRTLVDALVAQGANLAEVRVSIFVGASDLLPPGQ